MNQSAGLDAEMTQQAFDALANMAHRNWGLVLVAEKRAMVASRLRHRVRARGLSGFDAYSQLVLSDEGADEVPHMISALTTNVSHFFREPHHFEALSAALAPQLQAVLEKGTRMRIWSAGCSNGQEPYSIAMHLLDANPKLANADFKILATDIDPKVIRFARTGEYEDREVNGLPDGFRERFTTPIDGGVSMSKVLRDIISFRPLNLLEPWPMRGQFDAIFCRNVVIYFDVETQDRLWPRFNEKLKQEGVLFLGHSERMQATERNGFKTAGATAFLKAGCPEKPILQEEEHGAS
ncbi:MAG: protein-glutamate O-methyltransferase [Pseudomonadota bacterium]